MKKIINIDNCSIELSDQQSGVIFEDIVVLKTNRSQTDKVRFYENSSVREKIIEMNETFFR